MFAEKIPKTVELNFVYGLIISKKITTKKGWAHLNIEVWVRLRQIVTRQDAETVLFFVISDGKHVWKSNILKYNKTRMEKKINK